MTGAAEPEVTVTVAVYTPGCNPETAYERLNEAGVMPLSGETESQPPSEFVIWTVKGIAVLPPALSFTVSVGGKCEI